MPRAQIKDEKTYRELRGHRDSKEKAARIANGPGLTHGTVSLPAEFQP
jgi:hypothetical protein